MTTAWRERYFAALEEQEKLEKQISAHADMLRRTVVHLSSASEGLDATLDTELTLFKQKLRGASGLSVNEQLTRVEQAVNKWHHQRADQTRTSCQLLTDFAKEFEKLRIDNQTQQNIREFKRSIKHENVELYQQFEWLKTLVSLQNQALKSAAAPDKNLWQRLSRGTRLLTALPQNSEQATSQNSPSEPHLAATEPTDADGNPQHNDPTAHHNDANPGALLADPSLTDQSLIDPSASAPVAASTTSSTISSTTTSSTRTAHTATAELSSIELTLTDETETLLHEIFSAIVPTPELANQIVQERKRIDEGVNSTNVNHFLRAIRDTLQASYLNYGAEFSHYLMHMNAELARICQAMDNHLEDTARQLKDQQNDSDTLEQSQHQLAAASEQADIDALKFAVMEHLTVIEKSLAQRKHQQKANTANNQTLQHVTQKIHAVEVDAKATKSLIETEQHQANRDALTTLVNRTGCSQRLEQECERFQRYQHPVTLALCNIDGLAGFNDYGYIIGDRVLKLVATTLRERLRSVDFVGRFHGDKFLLILPETATQDGKNTCQKLCQFLAKTPLNIKGNPVGITLSFSVTTFKKDEDSADSLQRMMHAFSGIKQQGGNRVEIN